LANSCNVNKIVQRIILFTYILKITHEWKASEQQAAPLSLFGWQNLSS